jgi:Flp pilus assembly protein TadG
MRTHNVRQVVSRQVVSRQVVSRQVAPRRGAATVEFAIVAPLLLLVSVGMIEVTRVAQVKTALSDAVRNGCRVGIQPHMHDSDVTGAVHSVLGRNGINKTNASINIQVKGDESAPWKTANVAMAPRGAWLKVSITIPLKDVGWVSPMIFASDAKQAESLVMMRQ